MNSEHIRTVVITGVSSGIGEDMTSFLIEKGFRVFGSVRTDADAERLAASLGDFFVPMIFDVRDRDAIARAVKEVESSLDGHPLDALVNNAGLAVFGPMQCLDDTAFEDSIEVNLFGTRNVTNAFIPLLRAQRVGKIVDDNFDGSEEMHLPGKIINISSLSGIFNTPMNGAYCVGKHALESLGEIYRRELYPAGIGVFSIRSGPIQSLIWKKNIEQSHQYDDPDYQLMSDNAQEIMKNAAKGALPGSVISSLVWEIIENRKRKLSYEVGKGSIVSVILSSWVPRRLADYLINKTVSKPAKVGS